MGGGGDAFCALLRDFLGGASGEEFREGLTRACSLTRLACRAYRAADTLFGGGDVSVGELPDDLRGIVSAASSPTGALPVGSPGWLARTFLGLRALGGEGVADRSPVVRSGGVGEWFCSAFVEGLEGALGAVGHGGGGPRCSEGVGGRAEALLALSEALGGRGSRNLKSVLGGVSEAVLNLLPGVSAHATLAWLLRFAPIPSVREGVQACGFGGVDALKSLLRGFSPAVFDLSGCRLYRGVDEVPGRLLSRGDYLVTSGFIVVRREGRVGRDYVIYGEEVPASGTYAFLRALLDGWVRAEEVLFGTSPSLKALEAFVEGNLRDLKPRLSPRGVGAVEAVLEGREYKVVTLPGKDEFSEEDAALVLELTQLVTAGVMDASVGWDGVRRGNAVVNRYAVRFKPTHVLRASKRVRSLVAGLLD